MTAEQPTIEEVKAQIDRLIHDAQHAEAGMEFAALMIERQPGVLEHRDVYKSRRAKARGLRQQAGQLCQQHGLTLTDITEEPPK